MRPVPSSGSAAVRQIRLIRAPVNTMPFAVRLLRVTELS